MQGWNKDVYSRFYAESQKNHATMRATQIYSPPLFHREPDVNLLLVIESLFITPSWRQWVLDFRLYSEILLVITNLHIIGFDNGKSWLRLSYCTLKY